ncbi:MAG: PDZ domain-containing protein [Gemmatimonadetes bacterium]|nr:trypsin-like peptidase domain-containing protein [Gemmatimonadota bacterium]NNM04657.1 PDZ domain-containing protein [Gemmatimonadota bacterium]
MTKDSTFRQSRPATQRRGTAAISVAALGLAAAAITGCSGESTQNGVGEAQARVADVGYAELATPNLSAPAADIPLQDPSATGASESLGQSRSTALVRAADRVAPAVVSVGILRQQQVRQGGYWDMFMGPSTRRTTGFGSGFIIRPPGYDEAYVLTNEHVVRGAQQILVTLSDGRDYGADLVGADGLTDVAVLRIDAEDLPVAPLGTSRGLLIGEWSIAIGNPFAYLLSNSEPTVTAGVVSAVGRHIIPSGQDQGFYLGMIQTDASINPGNSGGPLVNALGEVIGVNTSIFSRSGGSEGLGFAIPIDRALRVAEDLIQFGEVRRAWTGVDVEAVVADTWGRTRGVQVSSVAPGSPADQAGLSPGDRLVGANGNRLGSPIDFEAVLLDAKAGDEVDLAVQGRRDPVRLVAEALPTSRAERIEILRDLEVISVTPEIRAERDIRAEAGALITGISASLSRSLSLARGDVILQINNTPVTTAEEAARALRQLPGGVRVRLYFERNGNWYIKEFSTRR